MPYRWMPSGTDRNYLPMNVWVRPKKPTKAPVVFDKGSKILHLPHVDLIFDTPKRVKQKGESRIEAGFHLRQFGPYTDWVMDTAARKTLTPRVGNYAETVGVKMCCDSGGFTLKVTKKGNTWINWIDPMTVIRKYNACADVGMALDAPPRLGVKPTIGLEVSPTVLSILARMQRENSKLLIAEKNDRLQLINVAHGATLDDYKCWIDTVNDPEHFIGWALACDVDGPDPVVGLKQASIFRGAALLYHDYKIRGEWLHFFKVSGQAEIPVVAWLGKYLPQVTSDSTSWLCGGDHQYKYNENGRLRGLTKHGLEAASGNLRRYCQCDVCEMMESFVSIQNTEQGHTKAYRAINLHNLITIKEVVDYWNDQADRLNFRQYSAMVKDLFGPTHRVISLLNYLECAMQHGPAYADRYFKIAEQHLPKAS